MTTIPSEKIPYSRADFYESIQKSGSPVSRLTVRPEVAGRPFSCSWSLKDLPLSFHALKRDLESVAFHCGFPLFSDGGSGRPQTRRFKCGGCINRANTKRYKERC